MKSWSDVEREMWREGGVERGWCGEREVWREGGVEQPVVKFCEEK
jgi:hypothetical protein